MQQSSKSSSRDGISPSLQKQFSPVTKPVDLTATPVAIPAHAAQTPVQPEFIRVPSKGRCPWTGLSRAQIYQLISAGEIRTVSLRRKGTSRGTRLICLQSLLDFLRNRIEGGQCPPPAGLQQTTTPRDKCPRRVVDSTPAGNIKSKL